MEVNIDFAARQDLYLAFTRTVPSMESRTGLYFPGQGKSAAQTDSLVEPDTPPVVVNEDSGDEGGEKRSGPPGQSEWRNKKKGSRMSPTELFSVFDEAVRQVEELVEHSVRSFVRENAIDF